MTYGIGSHMSQQSNTNLRVFSVLGGKFLGLLNTPEKNSVLLEQKAHMSTGISGLMVTRIRVGGSDRL